MSSTTQGRPRAKSAPVGDYDFVVVANRLPLDRVEDPDGQVSWRRSPGGLVTALQPVMQQADGAWVGWTGAPGPAPEPFDEAGMRLVGVSLSAEEVRDYYEGFSNDTLWPLYHDVIAPPRFRRTWWDAYVRVNERFAEAAAEQAADAAVVWVQDYQLQLVPGMLRAQPARTCGSASSTTFPFPATRSSPSCRGGARSSRACSAPTCSASSARAMPPTSCGPAAGLPG